LTAWPGGHRAVRRRRAVLTLAAAADAFFVARRPRKDSPHTAKAHAGDLRAIGELLARAAGTPAERLTVGDLTVPRLRSAFGAYADGHAKASINRCWSTWNSPSSVAPDNAQAVRWCV
jgi:integrase/recombinase XerC